MNTHIKSTVQSPPAFAWQEWYDGVGGRTIDIPEGDEILRQIYEEQYPRFKGPVAEEKQVFASPEAAAETIKAQAKAVGADIVGICEIEPGDLGGDVSEVGASLSETLGIGQRGFSLARIDAGSFRKAAIESGSVVFPRWSIAEHE